MTNTFGVIPTSQERQRETRTVLGAFQFSADDSFELICPDCDTCLFFSAEKPGPGEEGFFSNLNLATVVETVLAHKCEDGGDE